MDHTEGGWENDLPKLNLTVDFVGILQLICTITPASSNNEETHNTLKFAHRAKRIEIHASSNRILDEKSLIKKYQREICNLKLELEQLRRGILQQPYLANASHEDLLYLRQQVWHVHMNISLFSWM
jgi:centromeric protein E